MLLELQWASELPEFLVDLFPGSREEVPRIVEQYRDAPGIAAYGFASEAERGFDSIEIAIARSSNLAYELGERGVVTGMKGLTERELDNLARNYGWSGYP